MLRPRLLVAAVFAVVAAAAVALPGWSRPPDRTFLRRVSPNVPTLAVCREWIYGTVTRGSSVEVCAWDGRRGVAMIHAASDGLSRRTR